MQQKYSLLDNLVGAAYQGRRHFKADHLGGLQVDDKLELARPQDRQIEGFSPLRIRPA